MTLFTPFHKWVTEEHKLFTESVQKFYNDEMKPNIEAWVDNGVVSKSFWEKAGHAGIMSGSVLEEHGGVGGDMGFDSITVYEQAKTGDSSWGYGIQSIVIHYLYLSSYWCSLTFNLRNPSVSQSFFWPLGLRLLPGMKQPLNQAKNNPNNG